MSQLHNESTSGPGPSFQPPDYGIQGSPFGNQAPVYGYSVPSAPNSAEVSGGAGNGYGASFSYGPPVATKPARRRRLVGTIVALGVIAAMGMGVVAEIGVFKQSAADTNVQATAQPSAATSESPAASPSSKATRATTSPTSATSSSLDTTSAAAVINPALVDIECTFEYMGASGAGTGIVLTSTGEVLTNNHVISGATSISVTDVGNGKTYSASVVGYDASHDVAVLQLKDASGLQTAKIRSEEAVLAEKVVAVGNAGGKGGTPTAAAGTVTALNQSITASNEMTGTSQQLNNLIEVNADIESGDSGGALVDAEGSVIGVNTAASSGYSMSQPGSTSSQGGRGYAIPIADAMTIVKAIEAGQGSATTHVGESAFLGVTLSSSSSGRPGRMATTGAFVSGVVAGDPAAKAGIVAGDTITSLDGQSVDSATTLGQIMIGYHPGDSVTIGWVDRSGKSHTAKVTLVSGPPA